MHMKIEINNPENILPPPPEIPWTNSQPLPKKSQALSKVYPPLPKKLLPEISQPPWKTPPPQK